MNTNRKIYEDFLDDAPDQDIVLQEEKPTEMDRFPLSIFIYGSPTTITRLEDVKKVTKRLKVLAERTPGLYNEEFAGPVAFGKAQTFNTIPLVSGTDAIRYHFPGDSYYAFEIGCTPRFTSPIQVVNFLTDVCRLLDPLNIKSTNFVFRNKDGETIEEFHELKSLTSIMDSEKHDDFAARLVWRSLNKLCSHLFDDVISCYTKITKLMGVNPAKVLEEGEISSFKARYNGRTNKSKMASVKAGPKNAIMNKEITGDMLDFPGSCHLIVHEAVKDTYIGNLQCKPINIVSKEIIAELNQAPRKFQRVRWQTFGEDVAMFIGYLGLFWLESRQTLANVSLCLYTDIYSNNENKLFKFCENMINIYGDGEQQNVYRLYNDIDKAAN
jgi:hypothetical protein